MLLVISLVAILVYHFFLVDRLTQVDNDISNLYSSRDNIWREHFALQQTSKRRYKKLLHRVHELERKYNEVKPRRHPSYVGDRVGDSRFIEHPCDPTKL